MVLQKAKVNGDCVPFAFLFFRFTLRTWNGLLC